MRGDHGRRLANARQTRLGSESRLLLREYGGRDALHDFIDPPFGNILYSYL